MREQAQTQVKCFITECECIHLLLLYSEKKSQFNINFHFNNIQKRFKMNVFKHAHRRPDFWAIKLAAVVIKVSCVYVCV